MQRLLFVVRTLSFFWMLSLVGCNSPRVMMVQEREIQFLEAGQTYTPQTNGVFLSERVFHQLLEEKISHEQ